ncbi:hypothetical protein [Nocardia seriolae]|uniref:hypothetical protein n=1 Tax=Nocardia seriolae TaxID=37332 RepID=UPI00051A2EEE|nr:hypothetical protein [Nocardia seriolae]GEM24607.1 hypothetical protein NS2_28460 [Nocardia seriolae NBRC 15557]MTJ62608.1 hypothetical protein [Nocardia seriolae]MTK42377.1 hypothetical protein [Nocardia seriolae]WKY50171.1 hypothetical protein Q5P07_24370 [Nocardia seriolae]BEK87333.1 hypothetical protein NSERKGN1266_32840 [Nocardia seriolae]
MQVVLQEIVDAADGLLHGRPMLIAAVRRAAAGLPGDDFDTPPSEWEASARPELNHWLTGPAPFDDGPALSAHLDCNADPADLRRGPQGLASHPESLEWEWVPAFVAPLRQAGWWRSEIAEKLLEEIGDRCMQVGTALVELTEFKSADNDDMLELLFIDAKAIDRLDTLSAAVGRRVEWWRSH